MEETIPSLTIKDKGNQNLKSSKNEVNISPIEEKITILKLTSPEDIGKPQTKELMKEIIPEAREK